MSSKTSAPGPIASFLSVLTISTCSKSLKSKSSPITLSPNGYKITFLKVTEKLSKLPFRKFDTSCTSSLAILQPSFVTLSVTCMSSIS